MTAEVEQVFKEASNPAFWGELNVRFKAGKIIVINITKSIPLEKRDTPYNADRY